MAMPRRSPKLNILENDSRLVSSVYQPFLEAHSGLFQDHGPTGTWAADGQIDREASLACGDGHIPQRLDRQTPECPSVKGSKRATGLPISGLNARAAPRGGRADGAGFVRVARHPAAIWKREPISGVI